MVFFNCFNTFNYFNYFKSFNSSLIYDVKVSKKVGRTKKSNSTNLTNSPLFYYNKTYPFPGPTPELNPPLPPIPDGLEGEEEDDFEDEEEGEDDH